MSLISLAVIFLLSVSAFAHVHVQIGFAGGDWDLHVFDLEYGRSDAREYTVPVSLSARNTIPNDAAYTNFLGGGGNPIWILPQEERAGILYLGLGTIGFTRGMFSGDQIKLSLHRVDGPGNFAMYTLSPFGEPIVHMTSLDDVNPTNDFIKLPAISGHLHVNWAFSAPGLYKISFKASGILRGSGHLSESSIVDYTFWVDGGALRFSSPRMRPGGTFVFNLESAPNAVCRIEDTFDFQEWNSILTITNSTGLMEVELIHSSVKPARYIRAVTD
ncbi:MAG: choice-of-anchor M domain-containing protein [Verrucomicrobiota bacterium]|nr:choice-of-anchor M domain-containing protein [Verrucomicrobiota bacterium]